MKISIIRKGEYDIWSMRMRQYIYHTDHNLWDVIVNGDLEEEPTPTGETFAPPAPKTAKQLAAKRNQERVKSILLLAIPNEYLLKFHNVADAKSLWEAIKSRFGGNEESKKMQKNDGSWVLPISKGIDINQKFLRSLPPSWNQIALIMRNKPDIDEIDIDDLLNILGPCSFFAQPTTNPQLENEDFQQIDEDDLEELDLRWHVAIFRRNQGRRSYGDNGRSNSPTNKSSSQALVAQDGLGGYDWSNDFEVEPVNYALMAISHSSSSSSSDNEVQNCSKQSLESLESRILGHEKNELAWGEKYEFQNYELKCREIKINNLTMELEKVVKERDELKVKIENGKNHQRVLIKYSTVK
ncbi:hypothetical protein Tco_1446525 [Tanacetum coccineum]